MDNSESRARDRNASGGMKHPIKRVEPAIRRFITVLRIDVDRLQKHKQNIAKLEALGEVDALDKEQINASRTVQQLKASIRQLENTRSQVRDEDLEKFDAKIQNIKTDATVAVSDFLKWHGSGGQSPLKELSSNRIGPNHPKAFEQGYEEDPQAEAPTAEEATEEQTQLVVEKSLPSQESWNRLQEDLEDLNCIMHDFAAVVDSHQEKIDNIENNVETAAANVHDGTKNVIQANKWKAAAFPVMGAIVGGLLGGPVGVVVGAKAGGLALVGGGIAGFTGGTYLKKKQEKTINADMDEMNSLEQTRSQSSPELSSLGSSEFPDERIRPQNANEAAAATSSGTTGEEAPSVRAAGATPSGNSAESPEARETGDRLHRAKMVCNCSTQKEDENNDLDLIKTEN